MLALVAEQPIGIERYVRNVIGQLDLGDQLTRCFLRPGVSIGDRLGTGFVAAHPALETARISVGGTVRRILTEMLWLSWLARRTNVVLSVNNFGPLAGPRGQRRIIIVHDVWFMSDTYEGSLLHRWIFRLLLGLQLRRSHQVITISEFSRREISRWFGIPENQIAIVRNCLGSGHRQPAELPPDEPPFLLMVGSDRANKNIWRGISAFAEYAGGSRTDAPRLIVVGKFESGYAERIRTSFPDAAGQIALRGYVEDNELAQLYQHCRGLLFPSLYEGYGLPAMEAMMYAKPVLVSRDTACAEELGSLCIAVDGRSVEAIRDGIARLLGSDIDSQSTTYRAFAARQLDCSAQARAMKHILTSN